MTASSHSTVLKTLVITDLIDSTLLTERIGDAKASEVFGKQDRLARDCLARHNGVEIDKTDGFLLFFDRPIQAVQFAIDYHQALADLSSETGIVLETRVGVHLGEVVIRQNSAEDVARGANAVEVEGLAKPFTARLMALACGKQTLLSKSAFETARRAAVGLELPQGTLRWLAHGGYLLKGMDEPVEVCEVGVEGFAPLAPPGDTEKAKRAGESGAVSGRRPATNQGNARTQGRLSQKNLGAGDSGSASGSRVAVPARISIGVAVLVVSLAAASYMFWGRTTETPEIVQDEDGSGIETLARGNLELTTQGLQSGGSEESLAQTGEVAGVDPSEVPAISAEERVAAALAAERAAVARRDEQAAAALAQKRAAAALAQERAAAALAQERDAATLAQKQAAAALAETQAAAALAQKQAAAALAQTQAAAAALAQKQAAAAEAQVSPRSEEDAVRGVIAAYARAIEAQNIEQFRSVKPNVTADEVRRLNDAFRAVSSQTVDISILSVALRGETATVALRRRDTIVAGGKRQEIESQQTMQLIRTNGRWVIENIGQ